MEAVRDAAVISAKSDGKRYQAPGARRRARLLEEELGID